MTFRPQAWSIWVGFDPRFADAFAVASSSAARRGGIIPVRGVVLSALRSAGLYWRPTEERAGRLYDVISEHEMATEFAISRFLTPHLAGRGWALFMDCDMLVRGNLAALFRGVELLHEDKAVVCVKHDFHPPAGEKMDGQVQTTYPRKNWSSFMFFNVEHPANRALTVEMVNSRPGRDLHGLCWLGDDRLIGAIDQEWNWLVGHDDPDIVPSNVHFTDGIPSLADHRDDAFADEWRAELAAWATR